MNDVLLSWLIIAFACNIHEINGICATETGKDIGESANLNAVHNKPFDECCGICENTNGCQAYAWTDYKEGTCWLKNSKEPVLGNKPGVKIGFVNTNPSEPRKPGKTTRYWDCCKVSCGWNGKASFSQPVQSCGRNGESPVGINEGSSCGGGGSFACANNQPWSVSDSLAYGFAATSIRGKSEADTCCACYSLKFDGALSGKEFIVQSINTGGDLGEDHFDLQMPGGGVGLFTQGCKSQYGVETGWGVRYGGISSRAQCDTLPSQLQSGCHWRFDWFKNADNPTMQFVRVKCPSALTDISKCIRDDDGDPAPTPVPSGSCSNKYEQCGGTNWSGPKCCQAGSSCQINNEWYSQCL